MKNEPVVLKRNWYGFDHAAVAKEFGGGLTFLNDFCVNGEDFPVAVYKAAKPNLQKGHKKYFLLQLKPGKGNGGIIRGMSPQEMKKWRYQAAIHCLDCNTIIYSVNRHDWVGCKCKKHPVKIDGGRDYNQITPGRANYVGGELDLLTDEFLPYKKKRKTK